MSEVSSVVGTGAGAAKGGGAAKQTGAGQWREPEPIGMLLKGPMIFGAVFVLLFFGVFGTWAALAPLSSGAIAPGVVNPDLSRRPIQHEAGGTIASMNVVEGQTVSQGQLLLTLEPVQARASFALRQEKWFRLAVTKARIDAQVTGTARLELPPDVPVDVGSQMEAFVQAQQVLLEISQMQLQQEESIFEQKIAQLRSQQTAIEASIRSSTSQKALVDAELADKQALLADQLVARSVLQAVLREQARLEGDIASSQAQFAEIGQSIVETQTTALRSREAHRNDVAKESTEINNQLASVAEELASSRDILSRTAIYAPADGTVIGLRFPTANSVVGPRETIMDILPTDDARVVIARVSPRDIDVVQVGLQAHLSLLPFASRSSLPLNGEVTQVAQDVTVNERTQQSYYEVRIVVPQSELTKHDVYLTSGMPADVTIITGQRTMLQYLMTPFLRSLGNAFIYE